MRIYSHYYVSLCVKIIMYIKKSCFMYCSPTLSSQKIYDIFKHNTKSIKMHVYLFIPVHYCTYTPLQLMLYARTAPVDAAAHQRIGGQTVAHHR